MGDLSFCGTTPHPLSRTSQGRKPGPVGNPAIGHQARSDRIVSFLILIVQIKKLSLRKDYFEPKATKLTGGDIAVATSP